MVLTIIIRDDDGLEVDRQAVTVDEHIDTLVRHRPKYLPAAAGGTMMIEIDIVHTD